MSLTFKLLSLTIRTAAKPIGNYIKRQAREHDGFRHFAVSQAQRVHRIDMRMRLGILHDPAAQERMHEREKRAAEEKEKKEQTPTVRSELEQKKHDEDKSKAEQEGSKPKEEKSSPRIKIRPLSEAKAIELGANFFSEAFIFAVAAGLLVWDSWRSRRKEAGRRDMVAERLDELETEVGRLRSKYEPGLPDIFEDSKPKESKAWWNPAGWWTRSEPTQSEAPKPQPIQGNVPMPSHENAIKPSHVAPKDEKPPNPVEKALASKELKSEKVVEKVAEKVSEKAPERVDSVTATKKDR